MAASRGRTECDENLTLLKSCKEKHRVNTGAKSLVKIDQAELRAQMVEKRKEMKRRIVAERTKISKLAPSGASSSRNIRNQLDQPKRAA